MSFSIGGSSHALGRVFEPNLEQEADVVIGETVEDSLALAAGGDEAGRAEQGELMAYRRLARAQDFADVADAEFAARERPEYAQPGGIGEHLEQLAEFAEELWVDSRSPRGFDALDVDFE